MSIKLNTRRHTTYTITDSDFPDVDFNVSFEPVDNNYLDSVKVLRIDDNRVAVGYLCSDDDSQNPLDEDQTEGSGRIYSSHRDSSTHSEMRDALGLDNEWSPDLDAIDDADVAEAYVKLFIDDTDVAELIVEHERLDNETDVEYQTRLAESDLHDNYTWNLMFADKHRKLKFELWQKGRLDGTIGTLYAILLDVYDHSGQVYSISGEGMNCSWDTSSGGAVWIPDPCCLEHIMAQPEAERKKCAIECCRGALKSYNAWLSGDVYGVCIAICNSTTGEELSSDECWSYYTSKHAIRQMNEDVASAVKWELKNSLQVV